MTESGPAKPADPRRSPSYPQRVHIRERGQWQAILAKWEGLIEGARRKHAALGNSPEKPQYDRMLAQMAGARDQIADAVARLPMEVGEMYEEDKHRVETAEAALGRLFARWDAA